jgi:hypothetical protein
VNEMIKADHITSEERQTLLTLVSAWWNARDAPEALRDTFRVAGMGLPDAIPLVHPGFSENPVEIPKAHLQQLMVLGFVDLIPMPQANFIELRPPAFALFDAQDGPPTEMTIM